jgi:hypothetical protein
MSSQLDGMAQSLKSSWVIAEHNQKMGNTTTIIKSQEHDDNNAVRKPTIYIHIGPPKTGTTTIQTLLTVWNRTLLKLDHVEYLGFHMWPNHTWKIYEDLGNSIAGLSSHCKPNNNQTQACYQSLLDNLRTKYEQEQTNKNDGTVVNDLVLSDEVFTRGRDILTKFEELESFQTDVQDMYDLKIVVTYRRYEDWYPSARRQLNLRSQKSSKWVGPIQPQFPAALEYARKNSHYGYPAPAELIRSLQRNSKLEVLIYNFHEHLDNMIVPFACDILHAQHTCQLSKLPNSTKVYMTSDEKVKDNLLYDEIVSTAADVGLLDPSLLERKSAVHGARIWYQEIQNRTIQDIPMKCPPNDELKEYFQLSLDIERQMLPEFSTTAEEKEEESHKQSFWDAAKSKKYCSVDTDIVMKDPEWLEFFQTVSKQLYNFKKRATVATVRSKLMKPT